MKLSIIIVNYNVKDFLEQCLISVENAIKDIVAEVIIVDNNSVDSSCQMVKERFSKFQLIENKENTGFAVANNQALKIAKGEYVLLLNPDTLVEEDTFTKVVAFMNEHPKAGGLGVKMIDGNGHFLPESKRALPSPKVAFYKIFGLSKLFPKSKKFGQYHLSFLDKDQTHEVDVLSGAFMLMRKETLDKVGLLDETFFMYGEDIDLSYRIILGGYKNYYFADTTIIHYKGESTKKGSLNYVKTFYNAMIIFAEKHFGQSAKNYIRFIKLAIYLRASLSILKRFLNNIIIPTADFIILLLGFLGSTLIWEKIQYHENYYPKEITHIIFPIVSLTFVFSIFLSGGYFLPVKLKKLIRGIGLGAILSLAGYSLLDESIRFSRVLILIAISWAFLALPIYRYILHNIKNVSFKYKTKDKKSFIVVGEETECKRVQTILEESLEHPIIKGFVHSNKENKSNSLGSIEQLKEVVRIHNIDEVIFCAKDISSQDIISNMLDLNQLNCDFKIASPDSISVVGSSSVNTAGELYQVQLNLINSEENKRNKRMVDFLFSFLFILLFPIFWSIQKEKSNYFSHLFKILTNQLSFVGYNNSQEKSVHLANIKEGIISAKNNIDYAKNYSVTKDLNLIYQNIRSIGSKLK